MQASHSAHAKARTAGCSAPPLAGRRARQPRRELRRDPAVTVCSAAPRTAVAARAAHSPPHAAPPVVAHAPSTTTTTTLQQAPAPQPHHHHHQGPPQQPPAAQWLEQAVPALVRHLSRDARSNHEHHGTWLQVVHQLPAARQQQQQPGGGAQQAGAISLEHKRLLDFSPDTAAAVWQEMQATLTHPASGRDAIAVVLARPIPDPSHLCPLTTSSSSSCAPAATATAAGQAQPPSAAAEAAAGGVVEMQGLVDLDGCCGGSDGSAPTASSSPALCSPTRHAPAGASPSSPALSALARQLVDAPTESAATSSSSSSSSSEEEEHPAAAAAPQALLALTPAESHPHSHSHHHHHHGHPHQQHKSRSRRRFLRRQQQQQQQRAAAGGNVAAAGSSPETVYYGLAVQSLPVGAPTQQQERQQQQPSGCYVLKLSSNRDATGCTCTVFTVTHVCKGQPLYNQLVSSWLAEPAPAHAAW